MEGGGPSEGVGCQRSSLRRQCTQKRGTGGVSSGWDGRGLRGKGLLFGRLNPGNNRGGNAEWDGEREEDLKICT